MMTVTLTAPDPWPGQDTVSFTEFTRAATQQSTLTIAGLREAVIPSIVRAANEGSGQGRPVILRHGDAVRMLAAAVFARQAGVSYRQAVRVFLHSTLETVPMVA